MGLSDGLYGYLSNVTIGVFCNPFLLIMEILNMVPVLKLMVILPSIQLNFLDICAVFWPSQ